MTNTLKCNCMFPRTPTHDSKHVYFLQLKPTYSKTTQLESRADINLTLGLLSGFWWGLFWVWFFNLRPLGDYFGFIWVICTH